MPTVPEIIEKQCIDISLRQGVNEKDRPETIDWTKWLTQAKNVIIDQSGALSTCPGRVYSTGLIDRTSLAPQTYRILPFDNGVGVMGFGGAIYQADEGNERYVDKGLFSEFSVQSEPVTGWGDTGSYVSPVFAGVSAKYRVLVHKRLNGFVNTEGHEIVILDKYSGNVVRKYNFSFAIAGGAVRATIADDRYLHVYGAGNLTQGKMYVVDLAGVLVANSAFAPTPTNLTSAFVDIVDIVPITGGSVVLHTDATMEKFNNSGASTATVAAIAGFGGGVTGIAVQGGGTKYFLVGRDGTPDYVLKVLNSAFAVTRTVTDTTAAITAGPIRVSCQDSTETVYLVAYNAFTTTLAGVTFPYADIYICGGGATTFTLIKQCAGWMEQSLPFYSPDTFRHYCVFLKNIAGVSAAALSRDTIAGAAVVVDLTELQNSAARPAAVIDEYVHTTEFLNVTSTGDYNTTVGNYPYRPQVIGPTTPAGGGIVYLMTCNRSAIGTTSFNFVTLRQADFGKNHSATDALSGGYTAIYDGHTAAESGFMDTPSVYLDTAGAGTVTAGLKNYTAVYEFRDAKGQLHLSRTARVSSITLAGAENVDVQVTAPSVTAHGLLNGKVSLYRTATGETTYYLVQSKPYWLVGGSGVLAPGYLAFTDSMSDATLISQPALHRQPGTANTALDRYHAISSVHVCRHKDRVFYCRGNNIFYSSFAVDGESPWFSPAFFINVPGDPLIALASMDGVLVAFKKKGIWVIDGDGPPENGGTGTEFSPPRRILTEYGCTDARSLISTPNGMMYRSSRGIELLTRSLQVVWAGDRVMSTVDGLPVTVGSAHDRTNSRCYWILAGSVTADGQPATDVNTLCYDISADVWTTLPETLFVKDICYADWAGTDRIVWLTPGPGLYLEPAGTYTDNGNLNAWTVETGWIRGPSVQDRIKAADILIAAKRHTNHNLIVSVAYDYSDTYSFTKTFTPSSLNPLSLEQLNVNIPKQNLQAFRVKITTSAPSDLTTYPITTGKQLDLFGITVRMGIKGGGAKLSSDAKG